MTKKHTRQEFIDKANQVHGYIYDYRGFEYRNAGTPSTIICQIHGPFNQSAYYHSRGRTCPKCSLEARSDALSEYASRPRVKTRLTLDIFINRCRDLHQDRYDYSRTIYTGRRYKIIIGCPVHGYYTQFAGDHLKGRGCRLCAHDNDRKTQEQFIQEAQTVHQNRYEYDDLVYIRDNIKVTIICPDHGRFEQTPSNHLKGKRCPTCAGGKRSRMSQAWLSTMGVPKERREVRLIIDGKALTVDGYDPVTNTVYEFWGDYWHGNPEVFSAVEINAHSGRPFGELYECTQQRRKVILEAGYSLIEVWEKDYKNQ